jgi:hypothetical protein
MIRPYVPQLEGTGVDDDGLGGETDDQPVYIDVLDDDDGEHVQIYIG